MSDFADLLLELIGILFKFIGVGRVANLGDLFGLLAILFIVIASIYNLFGQRPPQEKKSESEALKEDKDEEQAPAVAPVVVTFSERLKKGLTRSRKEVWGKLEKIVLGKKIDDDIVEEMEELLYQADIGPKVVTELIGEFQKLISKDHEINSDGFKKFLFDFLKEKMSSVQEKMDPSIYDFDPRNSNRPKVIMIVGVNGVGKTTTIGKIATKLTRQGASVVVGACDTFRAAAVDQLEVWCERAGAQMVRAKEGTKPSGVAYEALENAIKIKADYCILDTAGRLHVKENLMEELKKNKTVLSKLDRLAPDEVLLVIDAITGQNALRQAQEFHKSLDLTGLIFTKCDSSSKGGSAVSIVKELQVPITYIGVGENVEDLNVFDLDQFLEALLGM